MCAHFITSTETDTLTPSLNIKELEWNILNADDCLL